MSANNNTQIERMRELIAILTKADIDYYRDDAPIMLDREYDKLTDELKELEASTGIILAGSPTQKVSGEILDSLTPVTHSKPMLSADKTKLVSDVQKFARGHSVMLSWKLDGLTLVLRYDNGEFKQAVTRGREGTVGEDVTHTVKTFRNVPLCIPYQGYLELRGEGVTSFENFENINMGLDDPYSLPRSFAAGSVRKLDSNEARKRGIEFYAFELVNEPFATNSKKEQQEFLKSQGFDIVEYILLGVDHSDEEVETAINSFVPEQYGNPTDGVIIEQDDIAYGRSLGGTGHHDNRMLAFKWEDDLHETKFLGVELATTRTGMVSITGLFESVEIDGANVNHAYKHAKKAVEAGYSPKPEMTDTCPFCSELANTKDNAEYYRQRRRSSEDYVYEYTAALVSHLYYRGEPTGKVTNYNYTLNYCPECGKLLMEAKYEPEDHNS